MIQVIVVDDHVAVRRGLEKILEQEPDMELAEEAISAGELLDLLHELKEDECDVVVLDITLPDRSGLEVLKDVKAIRPGLPVLILSIHSEEQYAQKARESGAAGYLTKYKAGDEVVDAIRKVASGGEYFSRSLAI
jgi:DNA-binding NarL/FixJ family response regulator